MHATNSVGNQVCHRQYRTLVAVALIGNTVGEDHLGYAAFVYTIARRIAHDSVRAQCTHTLGSLLHHEVGSFGDSTGSVDHVINQNDVLVLNIADNGLIRRF